MHNIIEIQFRIPVYYNGTVIDDISWENGSTVETICLLSKKNAKNFVEIGVDAEDYYRIKEK